MIEAYWWYVWINGAGTLVTLAVNGLLTRRAR